MGFINSIHNDWMGVYLVIVQGHYTECVPLKFMGLEIYGFFSGVSTIFLGLLLVSMY